MAAPMASEAANYDFTASNRCFMLGDLVGVTCATRIKAIKYEHDVLLLRYDIGRPLVHFYIVDFRDELVAQDSHLIFQGVVNYKHGVRRITAHGDELHVATDKGLLRSPLNRGKAPDFLSSEVCLCPIEKTGSVAKMRYTPHGWEVLENSDDPPLCCIPAAPVYCSRNEGPVLCCIGILEDEGSPEESGLPRASFVRLFGAVPSPVLVLGLPDGRVASLPLLRNAEPRLLFRLRQPVAAIFAASLDSDTGSKVPALIALGQEGQVTAMTDTGVLTAETVAPFHRVSWYDPTQLFHVAQGRLWKTQLRVQSGEREALASKSQVTPVTGVVDAQPVLSGAVAVLTDNGSLTWWDGGEGDCDPAALVTTVATTAQHLHRARQLLSKKQAQLRALGSSGASVAVSAEHQDQRGAPVAVKFKNVPKCGWHCCVTIRSDGGRITSHCLPAHDDDITLWFPKPDCNYLEVRPWLLVAPEAPLALPRLPVVPRLRRTGTKLAPAFMLTSTAASYLAGTPEDLQAWLDKALHLDARPQVVLVGPVDSTLVPVSLDSGDRRTRAALHCAVARCFLDVLKHSAIPETQRFQVLPRCAEALETLQRQLKNENCLVAYHSWRSAMASLVLT
ncbi:uncharacterized protein LOC135387975 [Ornithodoros turicata]|uniref:uncharacterized protein LOC135387975 n=1 Tax=Ornithodoros turicata TaxID=34597 RepID=UPI003138D40D